MSDPLTTLGLASNIVQLVDFTWKLFNRSKTIYNSVAGCSEDNAVLQFITEDINRLSAGIRVSSSHSAELRTLADETKRFSQELLDALESLRLHGERTKWNSFVLALKEVWGRRKVKEMSARVASLQNQLNVHLQMTLRNELSEVSRKLSSLQVNDGMLDLKRHADIMTMRASQLKIRETIHEGSHYNHPATIQVEHGTTAEGNDRCGWVRSIQSILDPLNSEIVVMQRDQEVLRSLWFESIHIRGDKLPQAHKDTFSWIFKGSLPEDPEKRILFPHWLAREGNIFWVSGKAGSGKSTLMKFLSHHTSTMQHLQAWAAGQQLITARFFFWNSGTPLQKSQVGLLRSLLFEILRQCPELLGELRETRVQFTKHQLGSSAVCTRRETTPSAVDYYDEPWVWSHEELFRAFHFIIHKKTSAKFCFFIDGLDEYKIEGARDHQDLVKTLCSLASSPNIKLCVSSRPWVVFADGFGTDTPYVLKLEDLTQSDIRQYVIDKFTENDQYKKLVSSNVGYSDLIEQVVQKARGVFLWVFLAVRDLLEGMTYNDTLRTIRLRLGQFPADLESYFEHMVDTIPKFYRKETAQTFRIALAREEPLLLITYACFDDIAEDPTLGLVQPTQSWTPDEVAKKYDVMRRRLDGRCKGLVEVVFNNTASNQFDQYKVDFLHRTARDYLLRSHYVAELMAEDSASDTPLWRQLCHAVWLSMEIISTRRHTQRSALMWDDLLAFAYLGWRESGDCSEFAEIFERAEKLTAETLDDVSLLKKACTYGLLPFAKHKLLGKWEMKRRVDTVFEHALTANPITQGLCPELVDFLLSIGSGPNAPEFGFCLGKPLAGPATVMPGLDAGDTVFTKFLDDIRSGILSPKQDGVTHVTKMLVVAGGHLDQKHSISGMDAKAIIRRYFSKSQASWLLREGSAEKEGQQLDSRAWRKRSRTDDSEMVRKRTPFAAPTSSSGSFSYQSPFKFGSGV